MFPNENCMEGGGIREICNRFHRIWFTFIRLFMKVRKFK